MTSHSNTYFFLGAAVVGIVSAAGIFLVEHFIQERRRHALAQNLARIDHQLAGMQKELEQLRKLQTKQNAMKMRQPKPQKAADTSTVSDDFKTITDLDHSDMEFYDMEDEEDITIIKVPAITVSLQLIDDKLNNDFDTEALDDLNNLRLESPNNPQLLWRIGKAYYKLASANTDIDMQDDYINKGLDACQSALNIDSSVGDAHKWIAALVGLRSGHEPIKEKISSGYEMKEHLDIAMDLLPNDSTVRHMLGRFAFESASLKWYERKIATALFAEPPNSTFQDALDYFLEADRLSETVWKENLMYIGKCYIALGQYSEAMIVLRKADQISVSVEVDNEVQALLQKYSSKVDVIN